MSVKLEESKIYKYVEEYFKKNNLEFKGPQSLDHHNDIPYDSVDRFVALYIIDNYPEALEIDVATLKNQDEFDLWYDKLPTELKQECREIQFWAYNNYEREAMSNDIALGNIIGVARKGRDVVLKDSYYNGGWFGAS